MSRFPFGFCFCLPLLVSSCASMMAPTAQTPVLGQSQAGQQPLHGQTYRFQDSASNQDTAVKPKGTTSVEQSAVPKNSKEEVLPQSFISNDSQPAASSFQIELGEPQPFHGTSSGPMTVERNVQTKSVTQSSENAIWNVPFQSSAQRQFQMKHSGLGTYRILVLGSIYGNEPESIELLESIVSQANSYAQSPSYSFLMIKTPNPDGLAEHIRTNHNGVDLNRNFPSTWFTANPNRLTGPFPASEIETKNMLRILKEFQPHRVLHIRSSIGQRPLILLNEQLDHAAQIISLNSNVDVGTFSGQYKAGSLEEFVTLRVEAEMMTVLLPPKGFQQLSSADIFQLATANFGSVQTKSVEEPVATIKATPTADVPAQQIRNILGPDGEKGYVELLPPPPSSNVEPFNRASSTSVPAQPKFYELPPPPQ